MEISVEDFCSSLVRGRLLAPLEVRNLRQRWHFETAQSGGDADAFGKWLVERGALTPYQVGMIQRGKADRIVLNDYKILDRIGQGRMAAVYKAVHLNGQVVALKVLPPSKAKEPELFARFQREARLALQLKHPNLIRTFQVGECDGLNYIVMEYLEGESLEEILRRRKCLPPAEAAHLLYQALLGLEHLHDHGMVHRDLEPANLMVIPQANGSLPPGVKILDVGLGRALFDEAAPALTKVDGLMAPVIAIGSPDYLAPEQERNPHGADVRSDIYSLGCILYRCLTGRPPFVADSSAAVSVQHATEEPAPLRQFNPAVPEELEDIVLQMLEKDPALRFPTPGDAALALQSFLPGFEESERPAPEEALPMAAVQPLPAPPPGGSDVELVPVAVPVTPSDKESLPSARKYYYLAIGYGLGAGSMAVVAIVGWKLLLLLAAVVLLWRWKHAWLLAKFKRALLPPPPAPIAVPADTAPADPSIQYAGGPVHDNGRI